MGSVKERLQRPSQGGAVGSAADLEALFEEARQLRRRRWRIGLSIAGIAAILGALGAFSLGGSSSKGLRQLGRAGPSVDLSAMRHEGELAFVSRSELYVVDGASKSIHEIPVTPGWTAFAPTFSHDGKWVAYQQQDQTVPGQPKPPTFWIARADGSDRHQITGVDTSFGWSPSRDLLAISTDTSARFANGATGPVPTRIDLVPPTGARTRLLVLRGTSETAVARGYRVWNAVWSSTGTALAVSLVAFTGDSIIRTYPIDGAAPTTWFSIGAQAVLPNVCGACGGKDTIADLAGWWPKWGIGFWVFSSGAVRNNDSTPIELVHTPGARPYIIARTLSDGTTDALAVSKAGSLAVIASTNNAGRDYGNGKEIATCDLSRQTCTPIPNASIWFGNDPLTCTNPCQPIPPLGKPGSAVSIDPAWSPTEDLLAYVKSPAAYNAGNPPLAWFTAHELDVYNPKTRRSTKISGVDGVSVPAWSSDGKSLLYVSADALWLAPATGGKPTEIATPLFAPTQWLNPNTGEPIAYYGQVPWTAQFNWWSQ